MKDCDYIRTKNNNFYIVKGYSHPSGSYYVTKVFFVDRTGNRLNANGWHYSKATDDRIIKLPAGTVAQIYTPENSPVKNTLTGDWKKIYNTLLEIGIPENHIGIFGSCLIGFPIVKDVDFIVYGLDSRNLLFKKITVFHKFGLGSITPAHIRHQAQKYSRSHNLLYSNFEKLLLNKWSSLQVTPEILSTIRFGFLRNPDVPNLLNYTPPIKNLQITVTGKVISDRFVDFTPRIFTIQTDTHQIFTVKTLFWAFQSCVKNGDRVTVRGRQQRNSIYIDQYDHGIYLH